ncbi:hypothetical protein KKE19_04390 [Patescibacteria group bacterium]|nr:hypothetical protein [Patescibacteria group bacterium]MBU4367293.1 hypothetical protein [Patescibacteria group bacterium]MBU4461990.1 hypothetical protein [Patescibacteria group bacterium]MCG2700181.1 hypothetical protein [Candidatus Parcubacteria bacterium]
MEIELERTFLVKSLPNAIKNCDLAEIIDIYIPKTVDHPILRIRKVGSVCQITKKAPTKGKDSSEQYEKTIPLSEEEYKELSTLEGKRLRKIRYYCPWEDKSVKNKTVEIDVYLDDFKGLVTADFEFDSVVNKDNFLMPDFCLVEVTQAKYIAAGWLAGRKYSNIEPFLNKFNYKKCKKN